MGERYASRVTADLEIVVKYDAEVPLNRRREKVDLENKWGRDADTSDPVAEPTERSEHG